MRATSTSSRFSPDTTALCEDLLPQVSRTFALTIPVLREPVHHEVALAYLLFRLVDCVEDHPLLEEPDRNRLLAVLAAWSSDPGDRALREQFERGYPPHPHAGYQRVLSSAAALLAARDEYDPLARRAIDDCWYEMIAGMAIFPGRRSGSPVAACTTLGDLERYCHVVAGVVGILLTRLFAPGLPDHTWFTEERQTQGKRLGIGLQLTNVLKDHVADGNRGICYVPVRFLRDEIPCAPFTPSGLARVAGRALEHLAEGHRYILSIPPERDDLRLFCLGAHHMALATVGVVCDPGAARPPKVPRAEAAAIWEACGAARADDDRIAAQYRALHDRARAQLAALDAGGA